MKRRNFLSGVFGSCVGILGVKKLTTQFSDPEIVNWTIDEMLVGNFVLYLKYAHNLLLEVWIHQDYYSFTVTYLDSKSGPFPSSVMDIHKKSTGYNKEYELAEKIKTSIHNLNPQTNIRTKFLQWSDENGWTNITS